MALFQQQTSLLTIELAVRGRNGPLITALSVHFLYIAYIYIHTTPCSGGLFSHRLLEGGGGEGWK